MNTFGRKFRVSIFGESHGELIGVVLDGVPAGLELSEQDFEQDILRRKSGARGTTPRIEADRPMIVSGVFEGHTTGAPLTITFPMYCFWWMEIRLLTANARIIRSWEMW